MLTLIEVRLWTGVTPFQWILHAIGVLIATLLLVSIHMSNEIH